MPETCPEILIRPDLDTTGTRHSLQIASQGSGHAIQALFSAKCGIKECCFRDLLGERVGLFQAGRSFSDGQGKVRLIDTGICQDTDWLKTEDIEIMQWGMKLIIEQRDQSGGLNMFEV